VAAKKPAAGPANTSAKRGTAIAQMNSLVLKK
jgi:hypothetical protein